MKILFLGDVVGTLGTKTLQKWLPTIKKENNIDFCVANGENSAAGNGVLPNSAEDLFSSGVDVITGGNHTFRRKEIWDMLDDSNIPLLRPANYPVIDPGRGIYLYEGAKKSIAIINLIGATNIDTHVENPFYCIDRLLKDIKADIILVDFHAEATSEKRAMGFYLDGRVTAVFGTHTHVQTADEQILPKGTAYITDAGMCGAYVSVLGVKSESVIRRFTTSMPTRFDNADGKTEINGVIIDIDENSKKATKITRLYKII